MSKNLIIITIDGARLDRVKNSKVYNKRKSIFLSQCITYGPHTIAAMHAVFSGSYGTRTGTNSYWSTYKFKKDQFHTLTEYLKDSGYGTYADLHSEIVIPRQGFDQFLIYDQIHLVRHCIVLVILELHFPYVIPQSRHRQQMYYKLGKPME